MSYLLLSVSSQLADLGYIEIISQTIPLSNPGITSPYTPIGHRGQFRFSFFTLFGKQSRSQGLKIAAHYRSGDVTFVCDLVKSLFFKTKYFPDT